MYGQWYDIDRKSGARAASAPCGDIKTHVQSARHCRKLPQSEVDGRYAVCSLFFGVFVHHLYKGASEGKFMHRERCPIVWMSVLLFLRRLTFAGLEVVT